MNLQSAAAAAAKSSTPTQAPKAAAPAAPRAAAPVQPVAQKAYQGAYSGALNNIQSTESGIKAVAARRQADAAKYQAYVMGQQGKFAAAQLGNDNASNQQMAANQAFTAAAQKALQGGLQKASDQQGAGPVTSQQLGGLVADQQRVQALLGGTAQASLASQKADKDRAGFLAAANNAALLANKQQIAGDEYNQLQQQESNKTNVLGKRTELAVSEKNAAAQAAASQANAQLAHEDRVRGQDVQLAGLKSRAAESASAAHDRRVNNQANRRNRLKTASMTAAPGGIPYAAQNARNSSVDKYDQQLQSALTVAHQVAGGIKGATPAAILAGIQSFPGLKADSATLSYAAAVAAGLHGNALQKYSHPRNVIRGKLSRGQR